MIWINIISRCFFKLTGKADIPSVDDHVSKLEHMGKETVKKLQDLARSAHEAGLNVDLPSKLSRVVKGMSNSSYVVVTVLTSKNTNRYFFGKDILYLSSLEAYVPLANLVGFFFVITTYGKSWQMYSINLMFGLVYNCLYVPRESIFGYNLREVIV